MTPQAPPPEQILMQMTMGKFISRMITTVANLGVADHMTGATPVADLARHASANADALYRLMRGLAAVGFFVESEGRAFALTPVSELLRTDHPRSFRAMCRMQNSAWNWAAWGNLDHAVKTGEPAFDHVHGMSVFEYFAKHPAESQVFSQAMTSITTGTSTAVADAYDFSTVKHLVDVGGSHGTLLSAVLDKFPSVRGTLLDLPHVIAEANTKLASSRHAARITTVGGNFLESVPNADAYIIKSIIHDWNDASCTKLLANCRDAMEQNGRVLLVESLVSDAPEATFVKLLDMEMLVATHGGRERTEAEFGALLQRAGLKLTRIVRTPSPVVVIEAHAG